MFYSVQNRSRSPSFHASLRPMRASRARLAVSRPEPIRQGRLNHLDIEVFRDGVEHPSPACQAMACDEIRTMMEVTERGRFLLKELAWGGTMTARYAYLAEEILRAVAAHAIDPNALFARTYWCNGDEYAGIGRDHVDSAARELKTKFFQPLTTDRRFPCHWKQRLMQQHVFFLDGLQSERANIDKLNRFFGCVAKAAYGNRAFRSLREMFSERNLMMEVSLGMGHEGHILFIEAESCMNDRQPFWQLPFAQVPLARQTQVRNGVPHENALTWREEIFFSKSIRQIVTKSKCADDVYRAYAVPFSESGMRSDPCPSRYLQAFAKDPQKMVKVYLSESAAERLMDLLPA